MAAKKKKFISFKVGDAWYGLPVVFGDQFVACEHMSPVPVPEHKVAGLIYHNGKVITVLDTARIFSTKAIKSDTDNNLCLLFSYQGEDFAFLIKEAGEILPMGRALIDRKKKTFKKYFKVKNNKFYILDPEEILGNLEIYG